MWRIILYLTPVTVALVLLLIFLGTLALRSVDARRPRTACRIGYFALALWFMLIAVATFTASDGSTGGSGSLWLSPGIDTLRADSAYVTHEEKEMVVRQWAANALMFVPLPVFLAAARRDLSAATCLGLCVAAGAVVESVQWLQGNGRIVDLDDVIFNSLGAVVGVALSIAACMLLRWRRGRGSDVGA
jgi:glycopeptide antibiotics resistance protein